MGLESVLLARGYGAAGILNADSPTVPMASLGETARHLLALGRRAVLEPADDGGYWLLDMRSVEPSLYARIAWSTDAVSATTAHRAQELQPPLQMLNRGFDVDDRAGSERLLHEFSVPARGPTQPFLAPATAACIAALRSAKRLAPALSGP